MQPYYLFLNTAVTEIHLNSNRNMFVS